MDVGHGGDMLEDERHLRRPRQLRPRAVLDRHATRPRLDRHPAGDVGVFVSGGGCSGFQYGFTFEETTNEDDTQVTKDSVTLLIDPMSLQYLMGAEIDYQDSVQGSQFVIKNPNAQTTCGCGSSFSA